MALPPCPRDITILVDNREKRPLPLPETITVHDHNSLPHTRATRIVHVHTKSTRLETGDYQLLGYEHAVCIERKASFDELDNNLHNSKGRILFLEELVRLRRDHARPILLLEGDPISLTRTRGPHTNADATRSQLAFLLNMYGISFHVMGTSSILQRRAAGIWLATLLYSGTIIPKPQVPPTPENGDVTRNSPQYLVEAP